MDNSKLLRRDLLDRLAEHVGVLEPHVRQQDDPRAQHVRRVVAAAETRLHDGDVDLRIGERGQRRGRDRLELRRPDPLGGRPDAPQRGRQVGRPAVEPDPLLPAAHVRRDRRARRRDRPRAAAARSSRVAVDLPFVPTTWTAGYRSCGSPRAASSACMRSSPKPSSRPGAEPGEPGDVVRHGLEPPSAARSPDGPRSVSPRCTDGDATRRRPLAPVSLRCRPEPRARA